MAQEPDSKRTLVIQPLPGIGDIIWHLPHLRAIAEQAPDRRVSLLTKRRSGADRLLAGESFLDEVIWLEDDRHGGALGGWRLGADLRDRGFETVWILHHSPRYALAAWRADITVRVGYGIGWQDMFLTEAPTLIHADRHLSAIAKATKLLELQSVPMATARPSLNPSEAARPHAAKHLENLARPLVLFAIGASEPFKQWGSENFARLATLLRERQTASIILLGGPAEIEMAAEIAHRLGAPDWLRIITDAPLEVSVAITSACDFCVGNDTGVLNIAAATGTSCIGLFGGSSVVNEDPRITAVIPPGGARHGDERMSEIVPEDVLASIPVLAASS